jgi:transposase
MSDVHVLAIDLAKRSFQVCATDRGGAVLFNRMLSRPKLMQFLNTQVPCIVAMEACATSHYWGRVAQRRGHDVRLIPPIYVKPHRRIRCISTDRWHSRIARRDRLVWAYRFTRIASRACIRDHQCHDVSP